MSNEDNRDNLSENGRTFTIPLDPPMMIALGIALVGLVLLCFLGGTLLRDGTLFGGGSGEEEFTDDEPELIIDPDGQGLEGENTIIFFDGANTLSIDLDPPTSLVVDGIPFTVTTQFVSQDGTWVPSVDEGEAEWVYGTIVNYVIGLPDDPINETLLETATPGDKIILTSRMGEIREFVVTGREISAASNVELFSQNRPQITLVWLGARGNDQRLVVFGDFVLPEDQSVDGAQGRAVIDIGETAQLADVTVTALDTTQIVNSPSTPPGFMVFLIDFEVTNVGATPLDTGLIRFVLLDDLGNQYPLNAAATQEGNYPILSGLLESGTTRQVTAGYQIPTNLQSSRLRWVVSRVDSPGQIDVALPFTGSASQNIDVSLQQATVSSDGTSLLLSGQITNLSDQPVSIAENDLGLEGGGSIYLVFSTNPGFPWTVAPGQTLPFAVTFQRPATPTAVFTLKSRSFELSGLR